MEEKDINSYTFYCKNFLYIKNIINEKYINQLDKVMLIVFYDNDLYKQYLKLRKDDDFIIKLKEKFSNDSDFYNNEEEGVFIICGGIEETIDIIINGIFNGENPLNKKELESINILEGKKTNKFFYITMIQILFFKTEGNMSFHFKELQNKYSE